MGREPSAGGRALEIMMSVVGLSDAERERAIEAACAGDAGLRREVERLLDADEDRSGFLETPAIAAAALPPDDDEPDRIGPYRVAGVIGRGGFGVVYRGEQTEPIERTVALKVIKRGMDSNAVIARFEEERRTVALVDHPNIARILDGGLIPEGQRGAGRPYFAMEFVDGSEITEYARTRDLGVADRIRLLRQACAAVQHAHTKGVIHRDLKPSNILVTEIDGAPVCKVIDFGIAKALGAEPDGATAMTSPGAMVGTPRYMSPEQARGDPDIDTRSDVHSLGAVLYELLTGDTPIDATLERDRGVEAVRRMVEETEPPAPSARRSADTTRSEAPAPGETTGIDPREIRGDLDWITLKALSKPRERRYETVAAFSEDLQRFLANQPVIARPPSASDRLAKFTRRNRAAVIAACVVVLAVLGASAASLRFGVLASRNAERVTRINEFLTEDLFTALNPSELGADAKLAEVLDRAAPTADERFADDPAMLVRIQTLLGIMYMNISRFETARVHLDRAIGVGEDASGLSREHRASPFIQRSQLALNVGELDLAESDIRRAIEIRVPGGEPNLDDDPFLAGRLGAVLFARERFEEAEPLLELGLTGLLAQDPVPYTQAGTTMSQRIAMFTRLGRREDAIAEADRLIALAETHREGETDAAVVTARFWKTLLASQLGRVEEAADAAPTLIDDAREVFGSESPHMGQMLKLAARVTSMSGRHAEAETYQEEAYLRLSNVFGPHHYELERMAAEIAENHRRAGNADAELEWRIRHKILRLYVAGPGETESLEKLAGVGVELMGSPDAWSSRVRRESDGLPPDHQKRARYLANAAINLRAVDPDLDVIDLFESAADAIPTAQRPDDVRRILADAFPAYLDSLGRAEDAETWRERLSRAQNGD